MAIGGYPAVSGERNVAVAPIGGSWVGNGRKNGQIGSIKISDLSLAPGIDTAHEGCHVSDYVALQLSIVEGSHLVDDRCQVVESVHGCSSGHGVDDAAVAKWHTYFQLVGD